MSSNKWEKSKNRARLYCHYATRRYPEKEGSLKSKYICVLYDPCVAYRVGKRDLVELAKTNNICPDGAQYAKNEILEKKGSVFSHNWESKRNRRYKAISAFRGTNISSLSQITVSVHRIYDATFYSKHVIIKAPYNPKKARSAIRKKSGSKYISMKRIK